MKSSVICIAAAYACAAAGMTLVIVAITPVLQVIPRMVWSAIWSAYLIAGPGPILIIAIVGAGGGAILFAGVGLILRAGEHRD